MNHRVRQTLITIGIAVSSAAQGSSSEFHPIGGNVGDLEYSEALSVNSTGNFVVGTSHLVDGSHAFLWTPSAGTQFIDGMRLGLGVSADGHAVVGDGFNTDTGVVEPVQWTSSGGSQLLGGPPGATLDYFTAAYDTSFGGNVVVGQTKVNAFGRAFRWTPQEGSKLLGFEGAADDSAAVGISDDGNVIVGVWDRVSAAEVGFRWTAATGVTLLESPLGPTWTSRATDVSPDGTVVVGEAWTFPDSQSPSSVQAFLWTETAGMVFMRNTIGGWSTAFGATQLGEAIVGTAGVRAFVWTDERGMERLDSVLQDRFDLGAQLAGWTLYNAQDISADGRTIVGSGMNPSGQHQAWVARLDRPIFIPEPSCVGLVAVGLGLLAKACRRRRDLAASP